MATAIDPATHIRLVNAVTEHDRRASKGKYYNPHALGMYLRAVRQVEQAGRMILADHAPLARLRSFQNACCDAGIPIGTFKMAYYIYQDVSGYWRWRFVASNGRIIAVSSESYQHRQDCLHSISLVKASANAPVYAS